MCMFTFPVIGKCLERKKKDKAWSTLNYGFVTVEIYGSQIDS